IGRIRPVATETPRDYASSVFLQTRHFPITLRLESFEVKDFVGCLGRSPGLWAVPAQMLDRNGMPPGNLVHRNTYGRCQALPLKRTRSVVAADYRVHELSIQTGSRDELVERGTGFLHVACQRFHRRSNLTILSDNILSGTS